MVECIVTDGKQQVSPLDYFDLKEDVHEITCRRDCNRLSYT